MIIFIAGLVFSAGGVYMMIKDMRAELDRIEAHLDSVDVYAHGGHRHP